MDTNTETTNTETPIIETPIIDTNTETTIKVEQHTTTTIAPFTMTSDQMEQVLRAMEAAGISAPFQLHADMVESIYVYAFGNDFQVAIKPA